MTACMHCARIKSSINIERGNLTTLAYKASDPRRTSSRTRVVEAIADSKELILRLRLDLAMHERGHEVAS